MEAGNLSQELTIVKHNAMEVVKLLTDPANLRTCSLHRPKVRQLNLTSKIERQLARVEICKAIVYIIS